MKLRQFQQVLRQRDIDLALFIVEENAEPNLVYFTQLPKITHAALAVPAHGKPCFFVSPLDYGRAQRGSAVKATLIRDNLFNTIKRQYSPRSIGIDAHNLSFYLHQKMKSALPKARFVDVSETVQKLRIVKIPLEARHIEKAASIANAAFLSVLCDFHCRTEAEVKAALEYEMGRRGASPSFATIVASGKNAAVPHHVTSDQKLQRGFCVIDFGANYRGYCSDCTRTIFIGTPSPQEKKLYQLLLRAQEKAIHALRPGVSCAKLDLIARKALGNHKKYFTHSLGHGIGVEVHEAPSLSPKSTDTIRMGMAVTIEPGIYIPNKLGIRIEDLFLVGRKTKQLTPIKKELIAVHV